MTGAELWEILGRLDEADVMLPVVVQQVNVRDGEGAARVELGDGPRLAVRALDPSIVGVSGGHRRQGR